MNISDVHMPSHFSGIVRLFPLPNLVLFPGVIQALHIFEPRYRKMTQDILAADHLVSICLYRDEATETPKDGAPDIFDLGCIGKIVAHKEMPDGRYNLMVVGLKRAKILRELTVDQPYRMAEVEVVDDVKAGNIDIASRMREKLLVTCQSNALLGHASQQSDLQNLISAEMDLGQLVDLISFTADLDCRQRQSILELADVVQRCQTLIGFLLSRGNPSNDSKPDFPPDFSRN